MNHTPQWYPEGRVPANEVTVRVTGLTIATADGRALLDGAGLRLAPGRVTALTGVSGSGKTTLLRAVAGALPPGAYRTAGRVEILGRDVLDLDAAELRALRRHRLAYVGQDPGTGLNPRMKVRHLLAEVAVDRSAAALGALLEEVRLPGDRAFLARRPGELSGGQQRRVALARALARRPSVLLLDEPTAGLDPALRDEIAELLRHLALSHRLAVALSCHDGDLVSRLADEVVHLGPELPATAAAPVTAPAAGGAHPGMDHPRGAAAPVLAVSGLHAAFSRRGTSVPVLHDIALTLAPGAAIGVAGPSGSGKTTLLRAIAGLHRPTAGTVTLDGVPLAPGVRGRTREQRRRLQFVPQDPLGTLNPSRTLGAALGRPLRLHRRTPGRAESAARIRELLDGVGLPASYADRYPSELSGGQRQRASIARALAADPDVLLCDEVTSALDAATAEAIMDLLESLRAERGLSLVHISHDLPLLAARTDTVLVLADGRAVRTGPVAELFAPV
ncbi:ABC transporter ATP-binding protein [Streptomyces clavuligerus]|uniref:Putative peptide ABC transporter ATP-binding protein n=1 Tax=Streptomyces clavuligerus TaxID=1901 RepID=E2PUI5_STRCL|nr:ATP-binding cassette domain-containing protein [Streptomyces clavuligerus]ANW19440.1 ABC transporter ATP-binding protein [Streptomyces clavuligerus]AXU14046.1 ABC transporter ATP-binding protein [Streptomyces clavuligerus]EFG07764.1 Putative peptide ABC transporter ATP-binding protein [Streptomyces clavuligerus]MBY6304029.1 ABC transporter ATP-binding protein [Streptomyces clavuligerus]QCS06819.1 ABC transporter ATP-binding protein [Streptomyces clavuligerus]